MLTNEDVSDIDNGDADADADDDDDDDDDNEDEDEDEDDDVVANIGGGGLPLESPTWIPPRNIVCCPLPGVVIRGSPCSCTRSYHPSAIITYCPWTCWTCPRTGSR